jgi:hypothetical protein
MANYTSQQRFAGWNLPEETATDGVSMGLDCSINVQQGIQPHVELGNVSDTFLAQDIQSQEMRTSFNAGTGPGKFLKLNIFKFALGYLLTKWDKAFSEAGSYPTLNRNLSHFPVTAALPSVPTNGRPGAEVIAGDSEIGPNYVTQQIPYCGMYHDCSDQDLFLSSRNFESHEHVMCGHLGVEQSQLNNFPTTSPGVQDMRKVPEFQSGFSQLHGPIYEGVSIGPQLGILSFPQLDQAQLSSSSFYPFDVSAAATSGINDNLDLDVRLSNQRI